MRFEWDEDKRLENIRKHGIDFRDVPAAFRAPMLNQLDDRGDYGEVRWVGLGVLGDGIVVVVYTEPDDELIRMISARKANDMSVPDSSKSSQTDWERLADASDDDIDYSDIPPLDESFFANASLRMPAAQETVTIRLDRDVLAWLRSRGEELGSHINSILRAHKEAHESA